MGPFTCLQTCHVWVSVHVKRPVICGSLYMFFCVCLLCFSLHVDLNLFFDVLQKNCACGACVFCSGTCVWLSFVKRQKTREKMLPFVRLDLFYMRL